MIRVVFDTNVLVSVALPGSRLQRFPRTWREGRCRPLFSRAIFEEYLRVLTYPTFRLAGQEIRRVLEHDFLPYAEFVKVRSQWRVVTEDPSDDKFLACAVDGRASWIVSGDRHLLALHTFRGVRIGSPAEFLRTLGSRWT